MTVKEIINSILSPEQKVKVKEAIKFATPAQPAPVQPAASNPVEPVQLQEATLTDGTVIKYNTPTLAAGSEVTIVSPEGEMPAPEGEHTLQDGTVIKVTSQDGKSIVESVTPGAAPADPAAPVTQAVSDPHAKIMEIAKLLNGFQEDAKAKFSAREKKETDLTKELADTKKELAELKANFSAFAKVIDEVFALPSAAPIERPKNKVRSIQKFIDVNTKP